MSPTRISILFLIKYLFFNTIYFSNIDKKAHLMVAGKGQLLRCVFPQNCHLQKADSCLSAIASLALAATI